MIIFILIIRVAMLAAVILAIVAAIAVVSTVAAALIVAIIAAVLHATRVYSVYLLKLCSLQVSLYKNCCFAQSVMSIKRHMIRFGWEYRSVIIIMRQ